MKYPRYFYNAGDLIKYWKEEEFEYIAKGNHIRYYVKGQLVDDREYESEEEAFKQIDHIFFNRKR